ncbi:MAG: tRNA (guanosine(46)-N7)-methyltransferase TrmB [Phototrophicales bacterium]|nr:MAG: tRNA (guanosine(46)-N7)-methyltransferase TrmB [Phototrophicales bacterium]
MSLPRLSAQTLPWAADWDGLFGRAAPLILEIGFGRGAFLIHLAQTHTDCNVIGVEVANRCLEAAESAVERLGLTNVRVVHARAETALHHLFRPNALSQVHINFPDPWFKRGHRHRRLMQADTLDALASRMQPGAHLYLATDILDYAEMSAALLESVSTFENLLPESWTTEPPPGRIVTKYEEKARREGRTPMYFIYRRTPHPAPDIPVIEELPMAHLIFSSPLDLEALRDGFVPEQFERDGAYIRLTAVYLGYSSLLFEAHVSEPTIDQHIALTLLPKGDGRYTVQVNTLGHPRMTAGVHAAVRRLGEKLIGLHPDARLVDAKLQGD